MINIIMTNARGVASEYKTPPNTRCYAIGDIHGRMDLLRILYQKIDDDLQDFSGRSLIIHLGDYIDRGNYSKQVIEFLIDLNSKSEHVFLKGNHEHAFLDFCQNPERNIEWLIKRGGAATLQSYGIAFSDGLDNLTYIADMALERVPEQHFEFLQNLKLHHIEGGYLFVHAGVRPNLELDKQSNKDLMFIREDFTKNNHNLPYKVVFGHTIFEDPFHGDDKIGVDTGAFMGGALTAVVLENSSVRFLQAAI